ncbi:HepT-like ribonuclease domain-containing protein [Cellulomonas sp. Y8]|uniref:HepT-like ribonuclease domain-containing protein n=1 Tax=Cellulomonas sp. Y8 TaxID=2591145 RepID=UPI003D745BBA
MTDQERVARRLTDLRTFGLEARYVVDRGRDAYLADTPEGRMLRNAGERVLIKVATVVEKLPESYKATHDEVPWVAVSRMRNLVAHHYDKVNDDVMWAALAVRVPAMLAALGLTGAGDA